ncbi:MAG: entericidin A/B family lipoprotein [Burkholderiaceae bacterium]|jgi:predicted small secreted protein|nr:entericidin A/B family lipoprotein [Burkholderiaceae bacterium]
MKHLIALTIIALTTLTITGCNTVAGIGKDVQKAGQVVQGAASH